MIVSQNTKFSKKESDDFSKNNQSHKQKERDVVKIEVGAGATITLSPVSDRDPDPRVGRKRIFHTPLFHTPGRGT